MADSHSGEQKRIAKNTMMLYIRMIIIMVVTLYTTRVVLNVLGETDYGIYNIVGSVVVSMVFIQNALMSATQRFLSYELGLGKDGNVAKVFSSSLNVHFKFLAIIVVILETIGVWFLNHVLDIPSERMLAANIVYQLSILTFCLNLIRIPYNSIIISYESMNIYAILSIVEAILKLSIVIALKYLYSDKLIAYGILIFVITFIINFFYIYYCRKHYKDETKPSIRGDKDVIKKLKGFLGWNLLGGITGVATNEGPNYFMNYYLGVSVNAAMGIAKQVSGAVYQFTANFQSAFNPQIVKAYASNEREYLFDLINKTSQLSFYLLFIFAFPILLCADFIFDLWLVDVPNMTVEFCTLIIVGQLVSALSSPLWMVAHATGDIKQYQIIMTCINLLVIPICYFVLKLGFPAYFILAFQILLNIMVYAYRLWFAKVRIGFPVLVYLRKVVLKCLGLSIIIIPLPLWLSSYTVGLWQNFGLILLTVIISGVFFCVWGLDKQSKMFVYNYIKNKIPFGKRV